MYLYYTPKGAILQQDLSYIALRILESPEANHCIQQNTDPKKPWKDIPAIHNEVKRLQSGNKCMYVGPDVLGEITVEEVIARIVEKIDEPHLVQDLFINRGTVSKWTSWKDIYELFNKVYQKAEIPPPSFTRKPHDYNPTTRIYLDSKRSQSNYISRTDACAQLAPSDQKNKEADE